MKFLRKLLNELMLNGKGLMAWVIAQVPGLVEYPGLLSALNELAEHPSKAALIAVLFQALWAGAAGHRLLKVMANAAK